MSSGPAWKRRPVGAWASGRSNLTNSEDFEAEEIIKKRIFHRTHLKLVDTPKNEPNEQIVSMKVSTVHIVTQHVDTKAVQTKENDNGGSGAYESVQAPSTQGSLFQKGATFKQKQVTNQKYNQETQCRPALSVLMGEVKRTSIETFPSSDELPSADDLPLGDLGRSEPPDQVLPLEGSGTKTPTLAPAEKTVDTETGSPLQRESCLKQRGAARAQPKRSRQYHNHERKHRPAVSGKGEVKQTRTGSFPPTANLLESSFPSDDHGCVVTNHVQIPERKGPAILVPSVVLKNKQCKRKVPPKIVKFASDIEENWGSAPPNQQKVYSRLEKNFDDTTVQLLSLTGGGGPSAEPTWLKGCSSNDGRGLIVARAPRDGLMGVIEVDSGGSWPMAEKKIDLGVGETLSDTTDTETAP